MKRKYLVLFLFLFFLSDTVLAKDIFRTCTYKGTNPDGKTVEATFKIYKDGSTDLRVDGTIGQQQIKNKDESYTAENFNKIGCPTSIVKNGGSYYAYYNSTTANNKKEELGKKAYVFRKQTDKIEGTSKTKYDSVCRYTIKAPYKEYTIQAYVYDNFMYGSLDNSRNNIVSSGYADEHGNITFNYFNEFSKDSSMECPQLKGCASGSNVSIFPDRQRVCPSNSREIEITVDAEREYSDEYDGEKQEKKSCTTKILFNNNIPKEVGLSVDVELSSYSGGNRCVSLQGEESCTSNKDEMPTLVASVNNYQIFVSFESAEEANKIYEDLVNGTDCKNFNVRQARDGRNINLTFTTQEVDESESAGRVDPDGIQDKYDDVRDFEEGNIEYKEGCSILGNETMEVLQTILNYLRIGAVALLLVLGSLDFAGAVMSDKDDAMKSAGKKFKNRLIACVVVFLIPALVNIALFVVNKSDSVCDFFGGEITTVDSE